VCWEGGAGVVLCGGRGHCVTCWQTHKRRWTSARTHATSRCVDTLVPRMHERKGAEGMCGGRGVLLRLAAQQFDGASNSNVVQIRTAAATAVAGIHPFPTTAPTTPPITQHTHPAVSPPQPKRTHPQVAFSYSVKCSPTTITPLSCAQTNCTSIMHSHNALCAPPPSPAPHPPLPPPQHTRTHTGSILLQREVEPHHNHLRQPPAAL
jgi:hypothetical protein